MPTTFAIASFYRFFQIEQSQLERLSAGLEQEGQALGLNGLIILAEEGINGTVAGAAPELERYLERLLRATPLTRDDLKLSRSVEKPFRRFRVRVRDEIVTTGRPPASSEACYSGEQDYLSPAEWQEMLRQGREKIALIDVRNGYETAIGKFQGAIDPGTQSFAEFPDFVRSCGIPREQTVLMYCTGGIRCEKAALEMRRQGYRQVYQLAGGILRYLEQFPNELFEGECFVFDRRVAVTQELLPSAVYRLCPHCGDPGKVSISCLNCGRSAVVCGSCDRQSSRVTCSKDCSYQLQRRISRASTSPVNS